MHILQTKCGVHTFRPLPKEKERQFNLITLNKIELQKVQSYITQRARSCSHTIEFCDKHQLIYMLHVRVNGLCDEQPLEHAEQGMWDVML